LRLRLQRHGLKPQAFDVAHRRPDEIYSSHRVVLVFTTIGPDSRFVVKKVSTRCEVHEAAQLLTAIVDMCSNELGLWPAERKAA
jgi:hypothetical protein